MYFKEKNLSLLPNCKIMNTRIKLLLCCLLSVLLAYPQSCDVSLKLMTYNIRHGAGMDEVLDLDRQAKVIQAAAPDVIGVQEVDSFAKRSNRIDEASYLSNVLGMHGTFGPAIPLTGGKYGVAILSKERPLRVCNIPLPGAEARTLLVCEFENYVFATTHLDLEEANRMASLPILIEEAARWQKPFFICGDWNDEPSSPLITQLKNDFTLLSDTIGCDSTYTFPADKPTSTIDYIANYGKSIGEVIEHRVIHEPIASDHRPIVVEIKMEQKTLKK